MSDKIERLTRALRQTPKDPTLYRALALAFRESGRDALATRAEAMQQEISEFRSQSFQDLVLDHYIFMGAKGLTFVDIGAHDGISYSNSWFFEKCRDWKGLCIEANPDVFLSLRENRGCDCVNACISDSDESSVDFLKVLGRAEMLSGIVSLYDTRHIARVDDEISMFGGRKEIVKVANHRLSDVLDSRELKEIHLLSIDTEGAELPILRSIDFKKYFIHAITVECNFPELEAQFSAVLAPNDFESVAKLGADVIFLNRRSSFKARQNPFDFAPEALDAN